MCELNPMGGVAVRLPLPNRIGSSVGIPTRRLNPVTSLAVELVDGMCRNSSRSKARPSPGPTTSTASTKAVHTGQCRVSISQAKRKAEA